MSYFQKKAYNVMRYKMFFPALNSKLIETLFVSKIERNLCYLKMGISDFAFVTSKLTFEFSFKFGLAHFDV